MIRFYSNSCCVYQQELLYIAKAILMPTRASLSTLTRVLNMVDGKTICSTAKEGTAREP